MESYVVQLDVHCTRGHICICVLCTARQLLCCVMFEQMRRRGFFSSGTNTRTHLALVYLMKIFSFLKIVFGSIVLDEEVSLLNKHAV